MSETVLVTGANRGIGLELAREYLNRGCTVYGVCRQSSEALSRSGAEVIDGIDVGDAASIQSLPDRLGGARLDILVNNAGIMSNARLGSLDYDQVFEQFRINAMGPLRVTEALLDNLDKGSKIGMITSRMGSIADNGSGGHYGYRMSKAALNAASVSLARDLNAHGIAVAILHPGFVQTDMVGGAGDITPAEAAQRLAKRIDELNLKNSGTFWHSKGDILEW